MNKPQSEKIRISPQNLTASSTFWDHVAELRRIVLISLAAVVFFSLVAHAHHQRIIELLFRPLGNGNLVFLSPLDPLLFILKIDVLAGTVVALPLIIFLLFQFITPALSPKVIRITRLLFLTSLFLLLLAVLYTYFVFSPATLSFLTSITVPGVQTMITAQNYLNFFFMQLMLTLFISQLPIAIVLLTTGGIFTPQQLAGQRKMIYFSIIILLSILTPTTDLLTLSLILLPTIVIFEASIGVAKLLNKQAQYV